MKWLARGILLGMVVAAVVGLYLWRVSLTNPVWPLGHEGQRVLVVVAVTCAWLAAAIVVVGAVFALGVWAGRRAEL